MGLIADERGAVLVGQIQEDLVEDSFGGFRGVEEVGDAGEARARGGSCKTIEFFNGQV